IARGGRLGGPIHHVAGDLSGPRAHDGGTRIELDRGGGAEQEGRDKGAELASCNERSLAERRHGGRGGHHGERQRRSMGEGGGAAPRRTGDGEGADPGGPSRVTEGSGGAPRSSEAGARVVRGLGALPRCRRRSKAGRNARTRGDQGPSAGVARGAGP